MFTIEQLKQLSDFLIHEFKEVFATKEDIKYLDDRIKELQTTMDSVAKLAHNNEDETAALGGRVDNVEDWVEKAAPKLRIKYNT